MKLNTNNLIKIFLAVIVAFFMFRIFSLPYIFSNDVVHNAYMVISKIIAIISLLFMIILLLKTKLSRFSIILIFLYIYIILVTFLKDGDLSRAFMMAYPIITILIFAELYKYDYDKMVKGFAICLGVLCGICLISVFLVNINSTYYTYTFFLGGRNQIALSFIVLQCCLYTLSTEENYTKLTKIVAISLFASALYLRGATSLIVSFLILCIEFIKPVEKIFEKLKLKKIMLIALLIFLGIILFKIQNIFSYLIVNVLNRNLTFTNRTYIWDIALNYIKESPIFGHGVASTYNLFRLDLYFDYRASVHGNYSAHNQLLQTLYEGGLFEVGIITVLILLCSKKLEEISNRKVSAKIKMCLLALMVLYMFEASGIDALIIILILIYFYKEPENNYVLNNYKKSDENNVN